jgi:transcriptional regulator with XRE-family HTH domain
MKQRLKELRKYLKLTQGEFAEKIGMTDASMSHMESGRTALSEQNIKLICLTFGVREEWLRGGKGEMFDDEAQLSEWERRLLVLFRKLSPGAQEAFIDYVEKLVALATNEAVLGKEVLAALKQAPGGATQPLEAPQEAKGQESTDDGKGERRADTSEKPV